MPLSMDLKSSVAFNKWNSKVSIPHWLRALSLLSTSNALQEFHYLAKHKPKRYANCGRNIRSFTLVMKLSNSIYSSRKLFSGSSSSIRPQSIFDVIHLFTNGFPLFAKSFLKYSCNVVNKYVAKCSVDHLKFNERKRKINFQLNK